jgi:hypothetical protein
MHEGPQALQVTRWLCRLGNGNLGRFGLIASQCVFISYTVTVNIHSTVTSESFMIDVMIEHHT